MRCCYSSSPEANPGQAHWLTETKAQRRTNTIPNTHRVSSCDIYRQSVNDALSRKTGDKSDKSHSRCATAVQPAWRGRVIQMTIMKMTTGAAEPYWFQRRTRMKSVDKLIDQRKFMQNETMKSTIKLPPRRRDPFGLGQDSALRARLQQSWNVHGHVPRAIQIAHIWGHQLLHHQENRSIKLKHEINSREMLRLGSPFLHTNHIQPTTTATMAVNWASGFVHRV